MKISPEEILLHANYEVGKYPYFISGNEETMIKKIEEIIINKFKKKGFLEKQRIEKIEELNDSPGLFYNSKLIILSNIAKINKLKIENIIRAGNMLIISCPNSSKDKILKKNFLSEKNYRLVMCYELSRDLKAKILNKYISKSNIGLEKDVYWFLVERLDSRCIFFYKELEKIFLTNNKSLTLDQIRKTIIRRTDLENEKIFFKILLKNKDIINLYNSSVNNLSEFYLFFHNIKFYFNLILENKTKQKLIENFPKYLFKNRDEFIAIYNKINEKKIKQISNLIYKTENLIRKNNNQFEAIGLRFLLNIKKIITAF